MAAEPAQTRPIPRSRLIALTLGSLAAGVLIVLGAILPAEFNRDPLGIGRLTGIARLWAPDQNEIGAGGSVPRAREYPAPFRSDIVEIPLGGFLEGASRSELEYKVRMNKDAVLVYAWEVIGAERPGDLRYDFHGHTTDPDASVTVAPYRQGDGLRQQGSLVAPFEGVQGWQFSNSSERPVVVRVRLSGYYDLIPSGRPGNEAGVIANVPAARARPDAPPPAPPR